MKVITHKIAGWLSSLLDDWSRKLAGKRTKAEAKEVREQRKRIFSSLDNESRN